MTKTRQLLAGCALLALAGCASAKPDNARMLADLNASRAGEVTVTGPVVSVLPDWNGPDGPHERFDIRIGDAVVEVDHNLSLARRVPVEVGGIVIVHGQFEPDPGRPVIHYTHHATGRHEGGWIEYGGKRFS